ncbi:phosphatase [Gottschalkiaceae bacterium SANA]|nr:phosphatase [Gottschalkiaceae bacterium SANA]
MKLVMDLHTHTVASSHAFSTLKENIEAAAEKGLVVMGTSDHGGGMPGAAHPYMFSNYRVVRPQIMGVRILRGIEANIVNYEGEIDITPFVLSKVEYVIASIHQPCYTIGSRDENTNAFIHAMKNPHVNIIGHSDDDRIPVDFDRLAKAAKETGVALELNNSSLVANSVRKNGRVNAKAMLIAAKKHGAQILLGSDAHIYLDVGRFDEALELIKEVNFPEKLIINTSVEKLNKLINHE